MIVKKLFIALFTMLLPGYTQSVASFGRPDSLRIALPRFHFQTDRSMLLKEYKDNAQALEQMRQLFADPLRVAAIDSVLVTGVASPDGGEAHNETLALERAKELRMVIHWKHPEVDRNKIWINSIATDWEAIEAMVSADKHFTASAEVLAIIRSNLPGTEKQLLLMQLNQGSAWRYIVEQHLWQLKHGTVRVVFRTPASVNLLPDDTLTHSMQPDAHQADSPPPDTATNAMAAHNAMAAQQPDAIVPLGQPAGYLRQPILAVKTNLLFDAATLLNIELEVPVGKRWSVAAEWICPWWLWEKQQHCLQVMSAHVEGRYWLGNRDRRQVLTGWFAGLYTGGGLYDLEWNRTGYQGEFFTATGVSGGFAHRIGKQLRMEYALGVGYLQTNYRQYEAQADTQGEWNLYKRKLGRYTWVGPTRAKVSLVWLIHGKKRERRSP